MLELRIINAGQALPLFDLPTHLGRTRAAREIGDTIEGLIAFMDALGGDPDLEDGGDDEPSGDEADMAWPEWQSRGPYKQTAGGYEMAIRTPGGLHAHEDDELAGDEEDGNFAEDEDAAHFSRIWSGPGCAISDPDKGAEEED